MTSYKVTLTQLAVVQQSTLALEFCCQCRDEPPGTTREQTIASPPAHLRSRWKGVEGWGVARL